MCLNFGLSWSLCVNLFGVDDGDAGDDGADTSSNSLLVSVSSPPPPTPPPPPPPSDDGGDADGDGAETSSNLQLVLDSSPPPSTPPPSLSPSFGKLNLMIDVLSFRLRLPKPIFCWLGLFFPPSLCLLDSLDIYWWNFKVRECRCLSLLLGVLSCGFMVLMHV